MTNNRVWGLAVGDILAYLNVDTLTSLSSTMSSEQLKDTLLLQWWDIDSRKNLIYMIAWLQNEGHNQQYRLVKQDRSADNAYRKFLDNYSEEIGESGLIAWDLGRAAALVRWGYLAEYLSEKELWEYLQDFAIVLQSTYQSWQQYGRHFSIGGGFWENTVLLDKRKQITIDFLVNNPHSNWQKLDWNMPLADATQNENNLNPFNVDLSGEPEQRNHKIKQFYQQTIQNDPANPYALNFYSQFADETLNDKSLELQLHYKSIEVDPLYTEGYSGIYNHLKDHEHLKQVLEIVFAGWLKQDANNPAYFYFWGCWMYDIDEYKKALASLRKAVKLEPDNDEYYVFLVCCLIDLGWIGEANKMCETGLNINPNNQSLQECMERIQTERNKGMFSKLVQKGIGFIRYHGSD